MGVFLCLFNELEEAGAKPDFVNENNALRATLKPLKFNLFNRLVMSSENLRGKVNVDLTVRSSARVERRLSSRKSTQLLAPVQKWKSQVKSLRGW